MELYDSQKEHLKNIEKILSYSTCVIDSSPMGRGKSVTALHYAKKNDLEVVIFCNLTMQEKFKKFCEIFEIEASIYSYHGLRGSHTNVVCHDYLTKSKDVYEVTPKFVEMVRNGVFVIFDEFQALKNNSLQHKAAIELVRCLARNRKDGKSRVIYLSETSITDVKSVVNIFKLLCITENDKLFKDTKNPSEGGIYKDIIDLVRTINEKEVRFLPEVPKSKSAIFTLYNLYTNILKFYFSCSMEEYIRSEQRTITNCFYETSDKEAKKISECIQDLQRDIKYDNNGVAKFGNEISNNSKLRIIEKSKVNIFARAAVNRLQKSKCKVIIFLNYLDSIELVNLKIQELDESIKPLTIIGKTPESLRNEYINAFQTDDNCRLVIIGQVARVGIDLDDKVGDCPRYAYISPSYSYYSIYQAIGRGYRINTKSPLYVIIVYCKNELYMNTLIQEYKILKALSRKEKITKQVVTQKKTIDIFDECSTVDENDQPINMGKLFRYR